MLHSSVFRFWLLGGFSRPVLYGTEGRRFKKEIVRKAAAQSERLYSAMVKSAKNTDSEIRTEDLIFDPTRPKQTDWEKILENVAEKLIAKKRRKKPRATKNPRKKTALKSAA